MNFSFTSIVYFPVTLAFAIIAYRFFKEWEEEKTHESFFYFLAFLSLTLVCFTGVLTGAVFTGSAGIKSMIVLSNILLTLANAFFAYLFFHTRFPRLSSWWGFSFIFLFGMFVTVLMITGSINPVLEPSGGVNWGMPLDIGFMRSLIYVFGMGPFSYILFKELVTTEDNSLIRKNLLLVLFFSMTILVVLFDFIIEPFFGMKALFSEVLILILAVIGMVVYFILHERVLARSEKRFKRLVENMHDLVCLTDDKYIIQYANQSHWAILGYKPQTLNGKNLLDLVFPDDREFVKDKLFATSANSKSGSFEFRMIHSDQHPVWVESFGSFSLDKQSKPAGFTRLAITSRDISERKQLENSLLQSQKMEAVGLLAGGIAHDFNNLLTVINGYSELIMRKLDKSSPFYNKLIQIKQSGDRAASLTRQLLAFSRKQILEPEIININKLSSNMEKMLRRLIREDIHLTTKYDTSLKSVLADPGQIEQVILNLVVNARDALPNGGKIIMETKNVLLDMNFSTISLKENSHEYVMLTISDNGIGMDKETIERIFEPFYTTKETSKGTGLGLSTVYGIIKQSRGDIQVQSEPGKGSLFKVYLPVVEDEAEQKVIQSEITNYQGSETILLAEDDDAVRNLATQGLRSFGYNVIEIANSQKAIAISAKQKVQLLLTDIIMPDTSGWKIADELNREHPQIKVLYMSGYTDNVIVNNGALDNSINFIHKPFTIISLAKKIRKVLDQNK